MSYQWIKRPRQFLVLTRSLKSWTMRRLGVCDMSLARGNIFSSNKAYTCVSYICAIFSYYHVLLLVCVSYHVRHILSVILHLIFANELNIMTPQTSGI